MCFWFAVGFGLQCLFCGCFGVVLYLVVACVVISVVCMLQLVHFLCFVGSYSVFLWFVLLGCGGCMLFGFGLALLVGLVAWWLLWF